MTTVQLSPHFPLSELIYSETATKHKLDNAPTPQAVQYMSILTNSMLEPIRTMAKVGLKINSGYRCEKLNDLVGGQPTSAHKDGRAADFVPAGPMPDFVGLEQLFAAIKASSLQYDQLIIEHSPKTGATWLHVAIPREGKKPRRMAFALVKREKRATNG